MNKYWKRSDNDLAKIMLDIGKSKGKKDDKKLFAAVNTVKRKYKSLHQASKLVDIPWTTFHRQTYVKCNNRRKLGYSRKLTEAQVNNILSHFTSDDISFPLPDKKFEGKCFMCNSVQKSLKMYNLLASTTRKISQASKYMANIPRDLGGCVDRTLCDYHWYFPNLKCVIRKCKNCGSSKFLQQILESNAEKLSDNRKRFLMWVTKTERKEGATQSFLHWAFEKCTYEELAHLLTGSLNSMAIHSFNASWQYCQYKEAKRDIRPGDVIFVHDFTQN